jgi:hypothetical protein
MIWSSRSPACSNTSTTSRYQYGVSNPFMRTERVLLPQSIVLIASITLIRALSLSGGLTESSRSRLITSAALAAIFGCSLEFDPGPNSWQRFGRATGLGCKRNDMGDPVGNEVAYELSRGVDYCALCCKCELASARVSMAVKFCAFPHKYASNLNNWVSWRAF